MEYRHTQKGKVLGAAIGIAVVLLFISIWLSGSLQSIQTIILLILLAGWGLFYSLTVEIKDGILKCHFGMGVLQKQIHLSEVQEVRNVRNPWYMGWGIRWLPGRYWMWNVSGFQAVELVFRSGRRFRIGTDEPSALVQAILEGKQLTPSSVMGH